MDHYNEKGVEKSGVRVEPDSSLESGSVEAERGIKPRLEERHIQMIAIAGVIVSHCRLLPSMEKMVSRKD